MAPLELFVMPFSFEPDYSVPVWDTIEECMTQRGMTKEDVAYAMCDRPVTEGEYGRMVLSLQFLQACGDDPKIIAGRLPERLEQAFDVPASFWTNLFDSRRSFLIASSN